MKVWYTKIDSLGSCSMEKFQINEKKMTTVGNINKEKKIEKNMLIRFSINFFLVVKNDKVTAMYSLKIKGSIEY